MHELFETIDFFVHGFSAHRYSLGTGTIWLTNVQCSPNDILLSNCSNSGFSSVRSCGHSQDVAVTCVQTSKKLIDECMCKMWFTRVNDI